MPSLELKKSVILKIFKKIAVNNRIKKNLKNQSKVSPFRFSNIHKIGCIVDLDKVGDANFLESFIESFHVRPENRIVLGYREKRNEVSLKGTPFFTWDDMDFSANVKNYHYSRLLETEYDILINYFDSPKTPLLLASSSVKAKMRIGFQGIDAVYNDLIINCQLKEQDVFVQEVKKIIQTIS